MLETLNRSLERALPFLTPIAVATGVLLSTFFASYVFLVPFIFAFITFASSVAISPKDVRNVVHYPIPIIVSLIILQVFMPLVAFGIGHLIFPGDIETTTGILLAFAIPTGVVTLMWVAIYQGSRSLTLAIILINTIISPFIVPLTLTLFIGGRISLDTWGVMSGLIMMVILPSALGIFVNSLRKGKIIKMSKGLAPFAKVSLLTVIMLNGSVAAPYLTSINSKVVSIFFVVLTLAILGYLSALVASKWLRFSSETSISIMFNCGMRNIGVGAAIAVVYFPPAVTLPVIMGTLFQQILAALFGKIVSKRMRKDLPNMEPSIRAE
ncbi:bile acid:sodium symporter family protein [Alkalicoccobacillus plakortidis]|uniref:Bile acid:sodium symporter family protein n=1 Tax=Alkalicoccobacillus plakortidis TaxID=444060 RepID=A0ABT0XLJ4_9BACI|nr:bile acid:sodium symporter family protein [Alkalicoccobacillus plakortidis]MCM2676786.1 bile acid:sodium symporter family protein [Alkalicoccobacillus plakortidis]